MLTIQREFKQMPNNGWNGKSEVVLMPNLETANIEMLRNVANLSGIFADFFGGCEYFGKYSESKNGQIVKVVYTFRFTERRHKAAKVIYTIKK